jgi:hypothetical protein
MTHTLKKQKQIFLEILRNETSLKGDEIMKVQRLLREKGY